MTAKRWGRVGDVPVIGAGTYASNADGCAVSATGSGEYFIRATVARDICARIANWTMDQSYAFQRQIQAGICGDEIGCSLVGYRPDPLGEAAYHELAEVKQFGGEGGVIIMGLGGTPAFAMNTSGMYRGAISSEMPAQVAIYEDERIVRSDGEQVEP